MPRLATSQIADVNAALAMVAGGSIDLDSALANDGDYCGITTTATVDTNSTGFGAALVLGSDGNYDEADADAAATMPCTALATETGTGSRKVLLLGFIREDDWAWTPGGAVYASTTAGGLTQTAPSGSGDQVQPIGVAYTADILFFCPSLVTVEID